MTREEAIRILDMKTSAKALAEIEYYNGFSGREAVLKAVDDACVLAVAALREQEERESVWPDPVPMTNADRIRSMTDRELADFFYGIRECSVCAYNYEDRCVRCSDGIFKWLQHPAEKPKEDA